MTTIQDSVFGSKTYTYDGLDRLTNDNGLAISYDSHGNILSLGSASMTYDSTVKNKLISVNNSNVSYSSTNPWQISSYMGKSYQYQGNRLTQYSNGSNVYSYTYNHLGQRITKTTSSL